SLQQLGSAVRAGQADSFEDLLGYGTPGIGPDRGCQPAPVRQGTPFNCREDAFEGPSLHRVIRRRVNVAELQGSRHCTISTASERQTSVTFPQSVQRASRPLYRPSCWIVRASAGLGSASWRASWVATPSDSGLR